MKLKRILVLILFVISLLAFVYSSYEIISYFLERKEASKTYTDYTQNAVSEISNINQASDNDNLEIPELSINFDYLIKESKDIIGWIYSPDTVINYPVVQAEDNKKYLHRLPDGRYNASGSIFADCRNEKIGEDLNFILYGHHMRNDSMFGSLLEYKKQEYYEKHPFMYYYTPDKNYKIELIAGFVTNTDSGVYSLDKTTADMPAFVQKIREKSNFKSNAEYNDTDRLITLSTCTNTSEDKRYVVIGVLKEIKAQ